MPTLHNLQDKGLHPGAEDHVWGQFGDDPGAEAGEADCDQRFNLSRSDWVHGVQGEKKIWQRTRFKQLGTYNIFCPQNNINLDFWIRFFFTPQYCQKSKVATPTKSLLRHNFWKLQECNNFTRSSQAGYFKISSMSKMGEESSSKFKEHPPISLVPEQDRYMAQT